MRKRVKLFVYAAAMVITIGAIFYSWKLQSTSAQNAPFKSYQLRVFFGDSEIPTEAFWYDGEEESMGVKVVGAGKCKGPRYGFARRRARRAAGRWSGSLPGEGGRT